MKRIIIFLLIFAGLQVDVRNCDWLILEPVQVHAQVMNKDLGKVILDPKAPASRVVVCPYCQERFLKLEQAEAHMNRCPYRLCLEYSYDETGNRVKRAVVWTVAPAVKKKQEEIKKIEQ